MKITLFSETKLPGDPDAELTAVLWDCGRYSTYEEANRKGWRSDTVSLTGHKALTSWVSGVLSAYEFLLRGGVAVRVITESGECQDFKIT